MGEKSNRFPALREAIADAADLGAAAVAREIIAKDSIVEWDLPAQRAAGWAAQASCWL